MMTGSDVSRVRGEGRDPSPRPAARWRAALAWLAAMLAGAALGAAIVWVILAH